MTRWTIVFACLTSTATAAAQDRPVDLDPETAARTVEPVDAPPDGPRRDLEEHLAARLAEERARLGQLSPEARALEEALRAEIGSEDQIESELDDLGNDAPSVARSLSERIEEQALPPTDAESRDPALPPPLSREEEMIASSAAALDPRRAPVVVRAVELELELDAQGRVHSVRMTRSSGRRPIDVAARRATERLLRRSFGPALGLHRVDVRLEIAQRVTRMASIGGTFDLGGGSSVQGFVLGRGLSARSIRVVRVRAPR